MAAKGGDAAKTDAAKPGEPPFGLKLEPDAKVLFKGKLGDPITVERTITNTTADRQCYKIKCTANDIFRVRQPLGFIEPKETVTVKISFMGKSVPENLKHFFAFYHTKSDKKADGDKNPRQIWTNDMKPQGVCRQLCLFELTEDKKGGEEKKEEKKDEKKEEKKEEEKKDDKKEEKKEDEKKEEKKEDEKKEEKKEEKK